MQFLRRLVRNPAALIGLCVLVVLLVLSVTAGIVSPHDPEQISRDRLAAPSWGHLMGTDQLGRDIVSRVIYGTRITLLVGFAAGTLSIVVGAVIGALSGYFGGWFDAILMRICEFFQIVPVLFFALVLVALFGSGIDRVVIVIALLSWPPAARLARAQFLTIKQQDYVEAARSIGLGHAAIIVREILPNAAAPIIVLASTDVASAILLEASLGFLGMSDPTALTWGSMLQDARPNLVHSWWTGLFPGMAIFIAVMALNLLGDGANDALNPRLRGLRRRRRTRRLEPT